MTNSTLSLTCQPLNTDERRFVARCIRNVRRLPTTLQRETVNDVARDSGVTAAKQLLKQRAEREEEEAMLSAVLSS